MKDFTLIVASLAARKMNVAMAVLLMAFGVALCVVLMSFTHHLETRMGKGAAGFSVVVGAKGSPLQMVLSSVYHIDIPTGNIPAAQLQRWQAHRDVKKAVPLALGDSYRGHRIVGTTHDYPAHYGVKIKEGALWQEPFEVTAGFDTGLRMGERFAGAHGLSGEGHIHESHLYTVTGIMARSGTVLDRLLLTSVQSVQDLHGDHHHHHHEHEGDAHDAPLHSHSSHAGHESALHDSAEKRAQGEITAILLETRSPLANINLPRQINRDAHVMAASPAYEMARLSNVLGLGGKTLAALSAIVMAMALFALFAGLAGAMENRIPDLSVMRALGFSRARLMWLVAGEGVLITLCGVGIGFAGGVMIFSALIEVIAPLKASGASASLTPPVIIFGGAVILAGLVASLIPAWRVMKINVARSLARSV